MTEENNAVTNFLDKYKYIIGVIIIIFLLVLAFIFISSQAKANKIEEASKLYYNWNLNVLNDNIEKSDEYLNELLNDYEDGTWTPVLIAGTTNPTGGGAAASRAGASGGGRIQP